MRRIVSSLRLARFARSRARAMPISVMPRCDSGLVSRTSSARRAFDATDAGGFVSMSETALPIDSSKPLPPHIEYAMATA